MSLLRTLAYGLAAICIGGSAQATVVYDNLPPLSATSGTYEAVATVQVGNGPLGAQFMYNGGFLSSVELDLAGDPTNTGGSLVVTIQDDVGNVPGGNVTDVIVGTIYDTQMASDGSYNVFT